MRRLRLRLRTLLIVVAVAALLLWGSMLATRATAYTFWARGVAKKRDAYQADILALERRAGAKGLAAEEAKLLAFGRRMMEYLTQQARYDRAARSPWLSVEPDPPLPPLEP